MCLNDIQGKYIALGDFFTYWKSILFYSDFFITLLEQGKPHVFSIKMQLQLS